MKNALSLRFVYLAVLIAFSAIFAFSQVNPAAESVKPQTDTQPEQKKDLLRELNLSRDQFQQVRRINAVRKPIMDAAQFKLRQTNKSLDEAIYSDQLSEQDFQDRLKAFQQAQAEVARIRFTNELAIRKLLTSDQLTRFRNLRRRFEEQKPKGVLPRALNNNAVPFSPGIRPARRAAKF